MISIRGNTSSSLQVLSIAVLHAFLLVGKLSWIFSCVLLRLCQCLAYLFPRVPSWCSHLYAKELDMYTNCHLANPIAQIQERMNLMLWLPLLNPVERSADLLAVALRVLILWLVLLANRALTAPKDRKLLDKFALMLVAYSQNHPQIHADSISPSVELTMRQARSRSFTLDGLRSTMRFPSTFPV